MTIILNFIENFLFVLCGLGFVISFFGLIVNSFTNKESKSNVRISSKCSEKPKSHHQQILERSKKNLVKEKEANLRVGQGDSNFLNRWSWGSLDDCSSNTILNVRKRTKTESFSALTDCPKCGNLNFHYLRLGSSKIKVIRECISCKHTWWELK